MDYTFPAVRRRPRSPRRPSARCSRQPAAQRHACSRPTPHCATNARARPPSPPTWRSPSSNARTRSARPGQRVSSTQGVVCMGPRRAAVARQLAPAAHALHRLLRPHLARARPGREDPFLALREYRAEGRRRDQLGIGRHSRSRRHVLSLRPGQEPPPPQAGPPYTGNGH